MKVGLQRVGILAAMGVVTLNIWTGAPLLGLWVGSRVAPDYVVVGVVILAIAAFEVWFFFFAGSSLRKG